MRLLREKDVLDRLGISRATLWRWERAGITPPRRQLGPHAVAWLEGEIEKFIASRPTAGGQPDTDIEVGEDGGP